MSIYKPLQKQDYSIEPFQTYADQTFTYQSGSLEDDGVTVNFANEPYDGWLQNGDLGYINYESGHPSYSLFKSIQHLYYTSYSPRINYESSDVESVTRFMPSQSCFVMSLSLNTFGERIFPKTITIDVNGSTDKIRDIPSSIPDMGYLYVGSTTNVIGNIFYKDGILVMNHDTSLVTGNVSSDGITVKLYDSVTVTFSCEITIYQHRVVCKIAPGEFNYSINPSVEGKFTMSGSRQGEGPSIFAMMESGSLTPYVTTIGLYNDAVPPELVAVGKLSTPIKRSNLVDQVFVVQFDSVI